ncbi:hypothetical protein Avbf_11461 [Armadillidium vulgare]|nr:hypothetical protein Avbf_11461 [Armadillidium vulgare]
MKVITKLTFMTKKISTERNLVRLDLVAEYKKSYANIYDWFVRKDVHNLQGESCYIEHRKATKIRTTPTSEDHSKVDL